MVAPVAEAEVALVVAAQVGLAVAPRAARVVAPRAARAVAPPGAPEVDAGDWAEARLAVLAAAAAAAAPASAAPAERNRLPLGAGGGLKRGCLPPRSALRSEEPSFQGTYILTASTQYVTDGGVGPTADTRETDILTGNTVQNVSRNILQDGGCEDQHQTGTLTFDGGTEPVLHPDLPGCNGGNNCTAAGQQLSATPTGFIIFRTDNASSRS